jgi:hypothetical protein
LYNDFVGPPSIHGLRTILGDIDEQLEIILDLLHRRNLLTPFLSNHDTDLEDRILAHVAQHSTQVSEETSLVSRSEVD